eukprot:2768044-Rhodomonas_salina.1
MADFAEVMARRRKQMDEAEQDEEEGVRIGGLEGLQANEDEYDDRGRYDHEDDAAQVASSDEDDEVDDVEDQLQEQVREYQEQLKVKDILARMEEQQKNWGGIMQ